MIGVVVDWLNPEKQAEPTRNVGSAQAVHEYTKAMLAYLPQGDVAVLTERRDLYNRRLQLAALAERHHVNCASHQAFAIEDLPALLANRAITAFHSPRSSQHRNLAYARSRFASYNFPITSLIHGLSYPVLQGDLFERLLTSDILPCDSVICTSVAAQTAFEKRLFRVADQLGVRSCQMMAERVRTDLVPLAVDTDVFRPRDKHDMRRLLGLPLRKTTILYFGRMCVAGKLDPLPLLLAFERIARKHPDVHIVLAGMYTEAAMKYTQSIINTLQSSQSIELRDQPSPAESHLYYSAADIFVSPVDTLTESFGLSPIEAMASGLPAVVSDWSGYGETVLHGKTGFLVPTFWAGCCDEADALAPLLSWDQHHTEVHQSIALDIGRLEDHLNTLVGNEHLRRELGEQARSHVIRNYSWPCVIGQMTALWEELGKIADGIPCDRPSCDGLETVRTFHDFAHFASHEVVLDDSLDITERGLEVARRRDIQSHMNGMQGRLDPQIVSAILQSCRAASVLKKPTTVGQTCERTRVRFDVAPSRVLYHILWLVKQDYLRIVAAPTQADIADEVR